MDKSQKVLIAILGIAMVSGVGYHMYQDHQNQIMQDQMNQQMNKDTEEINKRHEEINRQQNQIKEDSDRMNEDFRCMQDSFSKAHIEDNVQAHQ